MSTVEAVDSTRTSDLLGGVVKHGGTLVNLVLTPYSFA